MRERDLIIYEIEEAFSKEFIGGEFISLSEWLKGAKRRTKKQAGFIEIYAPDEWLDDVMAGAVGKAEKDVAFILVRVPLKSKRDNAAG